MIPPLPPSLVDQLADSQLESGAFASVMVEDGVPRPDENGFVTAQVLRTLGPHAHDARLATVIARALDFLETCRDPVQPDAYRFWPEGKRPAHLPVYPADADDTSVIALELARHGRLDVRSLRRTVLLALLGHRVPQDAPPPASWVVPGAFWTWLDADFGYNVVDCTVNANVVALMAASGLTHIPGYEEACAMIEAAIDAAAGDERLARLLSPYYPDPSHLLAAVAYAVATGAQRLRPTLDRLRCSVGRARPDERQPVFCSAYGRVVWLAPALQRLRLHAER